MVLVGVQAAEGTRVLAAVRSAPELAKLDLPEFLPQAQEAFRDQTDWQDVDRDRERPVGGVVRRAGACRSRARGECAAGRHRRHGVSWR